MPLLIVALVDDHRAGRQIAKTLMPVSEQDGQEADAGHQKVNEKEHPAQEQLTDGRTRAVDTDDACVAKGLADALTVEEVFADGKIEQARNIDNKEKQEVEHRTGIRELLEQEAINYKHKKGVSSCHKAVYDGSYYAVGDTRGCLLYANILPGYDVC